MRGGADWLAGAAVSVGLHASLVGLVVTVWQPSPMPQAPPAVSEVTLATLDVPSGAARARAPDASKAQSGRAEGAPSGGLLVPQTAAAALPMPASPVGAVNGAAQRLAEAAAPVASAPLVPVALSRPSVPAGAANLAAIATDAARAGAVRPDTIAGASAVPDMPTQPAAQPQPAARPLAPAATLPEARAGVPTRMTVTASAAPLHEAAARPPRPMRRRTSPARPTPGQRPRRSLRPQRSRRREQRPPRRLHPRRRSTCRACLLNRHGPMRWTLPLTPAWPRSNRHCQALIWGPRLTGLWPGCSTSMRRG